MLAVIDLKICFWTKLRILYETCISKWWLWKKLSKTCNSCILVNKLKLMPSGNIYFHCIQSVAVYYVRVPLIFIGSNGIEYLVIFMGIDSCFFLRQLSFFMSFTSMRVYTFTYMAMLCFVRVILSIPLVLLFFFLFWAFMYTISLDHIFFLHHFIIHQTRKILNNILLGSTH